MDGRQRGHGTIGPRRDALAEFSSEGPGRTFDPASGRGRKPDVTAPGAMLVSCLSADAILAGPSVIDQHHAVMAGTSMSSPFVAGVVACPLQRNGALNPPAIKAHLQWHTRQTRGAPKRACSTRSGVLAYWMQRTCDG